MSTPALLFTIFLLLLLPFSAWYLFFRKPKEIDSPFPARWRKILEEKVRFYVRLSANERARFEREVQYFLSEVDITGIETDITDADRVLVAASAIIPIFGFKDWRYRNLNEVLLYDGAFNHDYETRIGKERNILGMVGSGGMNRMMILSKPALHNGFDQQHSTKNVGIHEFVHLLDKSDGAVDGIPEIFLKEPYLIPWIKTMHRGIKEIRQGKSDINPYGGTNEAEFLSVVSEYFFQQPEKMEREHPELYGLLGKVYGRG
ncbi:MAG: zinc-dependent peptidase [Bacteroidetes bacterium]|nr:zinc-dependent peptidase [Bacteroidota bacterium]